MNIQHRVTPPSETKPVRWTVDDYFAMAPRINAAFERTELLDGVIYEMPIDGPLTREWNSALTEWLVGAKGPQVKLVSHQTLPVGTHWAPSPDHYLFPSSVSHGDVTGADVLLLIEVSDTTLAYDLGGKAEAYAANGVREYWVIDPNEKRVFVHRLGESGKYAEPRVAAANEFVQAALIPGLKLRLADLFRNA